MKTAIPVFLLILLVAAYPRHGFSADPANPNWPWERFGFTDFVGRIRFNYVGLLPYWILYY